MDRSTNRTLHGNGAGLSGREQFRNYGGMRESWGYFSWIEEEAVLHDTRAEGARAKCWTTLQNLGFAQYFHHLAGNRSVSAWYLSGMGNYFAGWQFARSIPFRAENDERAATVRRMIREDDYFPLADLVRLSDGEFPRPSDPDRSPEEHAALAWSLVYFLQCAGPNTFGWNKTWARIIPRYQSEFLEHGDTEEATNEAFSGVDWDELERLWQVWLRASGDA